MTRVAVIGAGQWGTTVAGLVSANAQTTLWARDAALVAEIKATGENRRYLQGVQLPRVAVTDSLAEACSAADVVVMGVPSHGFREVLIAAAPAILPTAAVLSLTKGIERTTLLRMTQVVAEVLPDHPLTHVGVLTGPNLAREIAEGQPTAAVIAVSDAELGKLLQQLFISDTLRVYTNPDVIGCEIAGASKNVMAMATGIAVGLGYGDNARAALITRGLAEITRLGVALGGDPLTFAGLAGLGDLVATSMSAKSRNHAVGVALGRGCSLADAVAGTTMVAEGVLTTEAVLALAARAGIDMPIASLVGAVLSEGRSPTDLVAVLMGREAKSEMYGIR